MHRTQWLESNAYYTMNRIFCIEYNEYNEEFFLFERNFLPVMGIFKTPSYPNSHTTSYPTDPLIQPLSLTMFSSNFSPSLTSSHLTPFNQLNPFWRHLIPLDPYWLHLNFPAISLLSPLELVVEHFFFWGGEGKHAMDDQPELQNHFLICIHS